MDKKYITKNINDSELVYSLLKEKYPNNQIEITYNNNKKEYTIVVTDKIYKNDPEVPVILKTQVIYGDSVTGDTPLLLKKNNLIEIKTIKDIFNSNKMIEYPLFKINDNLVRLDKNYCLSDYFIWCNNKWSKIQKVIRHKCNKQIYKISTNNGFVKVTEDHSLLTDKNEIIKPSECNVNKHYLLQNYPKFDNKLNLSLNESYILGYFFSNGIFREVESLLGKIYFLVFKESNIDNLYLIRDIIKNEYSLNSSIYDEEDNKFELSIHSKKLYNKYMELFLNDNIKTIPKIILNSDKKTCRSFLNGFLTGEGVRRIHTKNGIKFKFKYGITLAGFYLLLKILNINTTILNEKEIMIDKRKVYEENNLIKKIELISNVIDDYVYDIETNEGNFQAGIGEIIVKNTDSIFIEFTFNRDDYTKNRIDTFKLAGLCGDKITEKFNRKPIELEFEKVFQPFILLTKKRYIGKKYENMENPLELKTIINSGIALTRRNYCQMVKKCYKEVIDCIFNNMSIKESIKIYKNYINNIDLYNIEIEDLIVSAMLGKHYKTKPVHVQLAEKLKLRNEEVQIGDRIPYIYIENTSNEVKQKSELGEDPVYAKMHNLKYNRECYLNQLAKPLLGFFKVILDKYPDDLNDLITYTNIHLEKYGGKSAKLNLSDFKIEEN